MRASRGLKWENKMYKPKRSIGFGNAYLKRIRIYLLGCTIFKQLEPDK